MAIERRWAIVPPKSFTSDGTSGGAVQVADSLGFHVKQQVILTSGSQPALVFQVKRIVDNVVYVGDPSKPIFTYSDISAYKTSDGAAVSALEQERPTINPLERERAVYEEEPAVAIRSMLVDPKGNAIGNDGESPLHVAFQGDVELGSVEIIDSDGDALAVNPDGSINVNVTTGGATSTIKSTYGEANSVSSGSTTTVVSYTAAMGKTTYLQRLEAAGTNVAKYQVTLNGTVIDTRYAWYGAALNVSFQFSDSSPGLPLEEGDIVILTVLHAKPYIGDFNGRIQVSET